MFFLLNLKHYLSTIKCELNSTKILPQIFNSMSKNLTENEKHFRRLIIKFLPRLKDDELTLYDNSFADITFDSIEIEGRLKQISNNAFGKSKSTIMSLYCSSCVLENSLPNYNIWKAINEIVNLTVLDIGLNVTEIPTNAIKPINGRESKLKLLTITAIKDIIIRSRAFQNLNHIIQILIQPSNDMFSSTKIQRIEDQVFRTKEKLDFEFSITFQINVNGDSFINATFDGIQRPVSINFFSTSIQKDMKYLPESAFDSVLDNKRSEIVLGIGTGSSISLDCDDCRNKWLVTSQKYMQIQNSICKDGNGNLFNPDVQTKLLTKCNKML